jgi:uncharacterized Zn-binding protein involved in type VI secretion
VASGLTQFLLDSPDRKVTRRLDAAESLNPKSTEAWESRMPPAARIADPTTHGAPLAPGPGSPNVIIGYMPAWRAIMDQHACPLVSITGADGIGSVMMGSPTVFINNMMACRMGDIVVEKPGLALGPVNPILMGCPTVLIGEVGMGSPLPTRSGETMASMSSVIGGEAGSTAHSLAQASQDAVATVPLAGQSALSDAVGGNPTQDSAAATDQKVWIEIELLDTKGKPVANEPYRIELPDGTFSEGSTDDRGRARVDGIDPGNCKIGFPLLDQRSWKRK